MTAPKADTPTSATPPETVATPLVMSLACSLNVSSEPLPPLMKSPTSLCLTLVHDLGQVVAEPAHRVADRLREHQQDDAESDDYPQDEHRRAQRPAPAQAPLHRGRHRREDGDAENGHEDHEQGAPDRRERSGEGDDSGGHEQRPDRYGHLHVHWPRLPARRVSRHHAKRVMTGHPVSDGSSTAMETALWTTQLLLAAIFLATGLTKLSQPRAQLAAGPMGWAADVTDLEFRTVGLLEVLGALGLVLPGALGVAPLLTPLAAVGLAMTMIGAIVTHVRMGETDRLAVPLVLLALTLFVAIERFGHL